MKITVENIKQEYPKINIPLPEPLAQDKFEKLTTTFLPNYDKSDVIKKMVDTFVQKLNEAVAKATPRKETKPKPKSKPASKPQAKAKPKAKAKTPGKKAAPKAKRQACKSKSKAEKVEAFPEDLRLIRRFHAAVGKERQRRTILNIYRDMEKRITERKVNKNSTHAALITEIAGKLKKVLDAMSKDNLTHVTISPSNESKSFFEKVESLARGKEIRSSVNLLKRFIGIEGEQSPDKAKVKRLADAFNSALKRGKVCESDLYFSEFKEALAAMNAFLEGKKKGIAISTTSLRGLEGIAGLGKRKATTKMKKSASKGGGKKKAVKDKRTPYIVNAEFNTDLDLYINNKHKGSEFDLGYPSRILQKTGLSNLPIVLSKKILTVKIKNHGFEAEILKDLPRKLANPIMVFDSKIKDQKKYGISKMIVVGGSVPGEGILTVIVTKDKYNRLIVNKIDSIGGRNAKQIWYNIEEGYLQYHNKQKILQHLTEASIASGVNNVQDFITKIQQHFGIAKSNLSGLEASHPEPLPSEPVVVNRFQVDISQPVEQPVVEIEDNQPEKEELSGLFSPITYNPPESTHDKIDLPGDLGRFLGYVERYEYSILLRGEKGAGKTRMLYQMMNTFAKAGFKVGCFSLEIGKQSNLIRDMRNQYISPTIANSVFIADNVPNGLEDIKAAARQFDVVAIDSWGKIPGTKADDFDKLRKEFPETMFIVIFQSTTNGTARGGSMPEYDAGIVIQVADGGRAYCEKNRYNGEDLTYLVFQRKLEEPEPQPAV